MTFASPLTAALRPEPARGRMARQVAGAENVEIKAIIEAENVRKALKLLGLAPDKGELRLIYFFDTPKLALFKAKTIVRARRVPGGDHDSTVKIRPVTPNDVPTKWSKDHGFKLEADAGATAIVRSASLSRNLSKGLVKDVTSGKKPVSALFDEQQELFLAEMCQIRYDLDGLAILGPVSALWWKVAHPGLPAPMTAELWTREDKETMLEVSIRVPAAQAAFAAAGFLAFLAELGAERENAQQAKTRWALEFHAERTGAKSAKGTKGTAKARVKAARDMARKVVGSHKHEGAAAKAHKSKPAKHSKKARGEGLATASGPPPAKGQAAPPPREVAPAVVAASVKPAGVRRSPRHAKAGTADTPGAGSTLPDRGPDTAA